MKLNQIDGNNKVMQSILKIVVMGVVVFKWHKMKLKFHKAWQSRVTRFCI